jgi:hypothetical protein
MVVIFDRMKEDGREPRYRSDSVTDIFLCQQLILRAKLRVMQYSRLFLMAVTASYDVR